MSNPTPRQMQAKMEEQLRFIMAECGLTEPADVPWIEEGGWWHKRLVGIDGQILRIYFRHSRSLQLDTDYVRLNTCQDDRARTAEGARRT
jgi:hypothetical protein